MTLFRRPIARASVDDAGRSGGLLTKIVVASFLVLFGRLFQLQVLQGDRYLQRATDNVVKERLIPSVRGRIRDRHGVVLVDNRPSFDVYVTPKSFSAEAHARFVGLLGLSASEVSEFVTRVDRARVRAPNRAALVLEDVDRDRLALIEQAKTDLPGVDVEDVPHRYYPHGPLAAHLLGYMNQISDAELSEHANDGYEPGEYIGRYGIERQWESYLRGKKGIDRFVVNARGKRLSEKDAQELITGERFIPPVPGHDLVLTLDVDLQRLAERALRNHPSGGIAVIDVHSGEILALVSKPAFDPNVMTGHLSRAEEAAMEADPFKPFLDKTLRQHYYPGSVFKFLVAAAALEDKLITPEERFVCQGSIEFGKQRLRCGKDHGKVNLFEAMTQSCNVYFWHLAEKVGMDRLADMANAFGFGAPTGLGLNGDVPGHIPRKADYVERGGFRIGYTLNSAIGQGDLVVTVLQMALAYAALANGGDLWAPEIVRRVLGADGALVADMAPQLRRRVPVSRESLQALQKGLWGVVNDSRGTAFSARLDGVSAAGKTGTAQVRKMTARKQSGYDPYGDHAWFAGYAPAENPEVAVVVLVDHGGKGGQVAAPVAMEVIRAYFAGKEAPASQPKEARAP